MESIRLLVISLITVWEILEIIGIILISLLILIVLLTYNMNKNRSTRFYKTYDNLTQNKSVLSKYEITQIKIKQDSHENTLYGEISNKRRDKMLSMSVTEKEKRLKSLISTHKRYMISLYSLIIITVLFVLTAFITRPSDGWYYYVPLLISIFVYINFFVSYLKKKNAESLFQIYRVLLATNEPPNLLWHNSEKEFTNKTLAIDHLKKEIVIDSEGLVNFDENQKIKGVKKFNLADIVEWNTQIDVYKYHPANYFAESNEIHNFIMVFVRGFYTVTDPYSYISRNLIIFLKSVKMTVKFTNGDVHVFEVLPHHFNYRYAIGGSEEFQMVDTKFKRMYNLLLISGYLLYNYEEKGSIIEKSTEYKI